MNDKSSNFPQFPFDSQILLDIYGVQWMYDASTETWDRMGDKENIPLASDTKSGLLSPMLKTKVDGIPERGGGGAIIIKPLKRNLDNTDGIILGDIKLVSESLDILCVDSQGKEVGKGCDVDFEVAPDEEGQEPRRPGFNFQIKSKTFDAFCIRVPGIPGPLGKIGAKGKKGEPGTGDGPRGAQGKAGKDVTEPGVFTDVKILEESGTYDTAVVGLELDADRGILNVVKSKVKVPTDKTPAEQVIADQMVRSINFTDGWKFNIAKPPDDTLADDPYVMHLPVGFNPANGTPSEISSKKLSYLTNKIIGRYQQDLAKVEAEYDKLLREYILLKDEEARKILADIAQKLAECEWQLPIEFCLGISPKDCDWSQSSGGSGAPICTGTKNVEVKRKVYSREYADPAKTTPSEFVIDAAAVIAAQVTGKIQKVHAKVDYDHYGYADKLDIVYNNNTIASTNTPVPFKGTLEGDGTGDSSIVKLVTTPSRDGSYWEYDITLTFEVCYKSSTPNAGGAGGQHGHYSGSGPRTVILSKGGEIPESGGNLIVSAESEIDQMGGSVTGVNIIVTFAKGDYEITVNFDGMPVAGIDASNCIQWTADPLNPSVMSCTIAFPAAGTAKDVNVSSTGGKVKVAIDFRVYVS